MVEDIYKHEYETTPITLDALQKKYGLTTLPDDAEHWVKAPGIAIVTSATQPNALQQTNTLSEDVERAKKEIIKQVNSKLAFDGDDIDTKELKDLSAIVQNMEPKKVDTTPTVNILVQNIQERFKDDI